MAPKTYFGTPPKLDFLTILALVKAGSERRRGGDALSSSFLTFGEDYGQSTGPTRNR